MKYLKKPTSGSGMQANVNIIDDDYSKSREFGYDTDEINQQNSMTNQTTYSAAGLSSHTYKITKDDKANFRRQVILQKIKSSDDSKSKSRDHHYFS